MTHMVMDMDGQSVIEDARPGVEGGPGFNTIQLTLLINSNVVLKLRLRPVNF